MRLKRLALALAAAGFVSGAAIGTYGWETWGGAHAAANTTATTPANPVAGAQQLPNFGWIAERFGPAVVNVVAVQEADATPAAKREWPNLPKDDPFYEFFKRFDMPMPRGEAPMPFGNQPARGFGSGFIVGSDGVILTNAHVVRDAKDVTVKLTDKREFKAKVLGVDAASDVAVLKIEAKDLPTVTLGNPGETKVGDWVVAIGSPFGFENTLTQGIVSAKGRALPDETYVPFIQTDVAVNPGNSGGPLFNLRGEVIGINSQIYSRTGGYEGLSFAIPIDMAMNVKDQLQERGYVARGRLGVAIQAVDHNLAQSFGMNEPMGALISSVDKDGAAAKAGLESGDVILKVNGKDIRNSSELPLMIANAKPGSKVQIEVWRKGAKHELNATLGEMKDAKSAAAAQKAPVAQGKLGLSVRPLTAEERKEASIDGGLLVQDVAGAAAKAGIQAGDVILAANGTPVASVEELRSAADRATKNIALLVQRDGARLYVPVLLG